MLRKVNSYMRSGQVAKIFIVSELVGFFGSYLVWRYLNNDHVNRKFAHKNFPTVLEMYYKLGETIDENNNMRETDLKTWRAQGYRIE